MGCLFCDIVSKKIPAAIVYEDEAILAFKDINAQAPTHILIIPKAHIATLNDLQEKDASIIGLLTIGAQKIAKELNVAEDGYRVVMNCNSHGGQSVYHIHMHLLAGRQMSWPPG